MPTHTILAHHTRNRIRLRIPHKRKDIAYFMDLYQALREIPTVSEVQINPITGSVLLHFPEGTARRIFRSLEQMGLCSAGSQTHFRPGILCRIERYFAQDQSTATQMRTVLFALTVALAVHQVSRGKLLFPAISVLWYAYHVIVSGKREGATAQVATATPSLSPDM